MSGSPWVVTGGAGYIGSHVVRALRRAGRPVTVVDDLSTGLTGRVPPDVELVQANLLDTQTVTDVFTRVRPKGVVHLAAKKSPTESVADPLKYGRENVGGLVSLLEAARAADVDRVVFSSSCSVYGTPDLDLVPEDAPSRPESPYGESKLYGEHLLQASATAYGLGVVNLRYFNVVGADGPELRDTGAYNLVPLVFQALRGGHRARVYGGDYPTPDGTCIRDYVDVRDLADAHVRAAEALEDDPRLATYNVGCGEGSSVLEVLRTVGDVTGREIDYDVVDRRPGDPARIVGDVRRISDELGWTASRDLRDMVASAWAAESRTSPPG